jgi:hypothetical protein
MPDTRLSERDARDVRYISQQGCGELIVQPASKPFVAALDPLAIARRPVAAGEGQSAARTLT